MKSAVVTLVFIFTELLSRSRGRGRHLSSAIVLRHIKAAIMRQRFKGFFTALHKTLSQNSIYSTLMQILIICSFYRFLSLKSTLRQILTSKRTTTELTSSPVWPPYIPPIANVCTFLVIHILTKAQQFSEKPKDSSSPEMAKGCIQIS